MLIFLISAGVTPSRCRIHCQLNGVGCPSITVERYSLWLTKVQINIVIKGEDSRNQLKAETIHFDVLVAVIVAFRTSVGVRILIGIAA